MIIEDLPTYPNGRGGYGDYLGFAYKDGTKYKLNYSSADERAHCECGELCDVGLWEEAWEKLDEYEGICRRKPDPRLQARVVAGLYKERVKSGKMSGKEALNQIILVIGYEMSNDGGSETETIIDKVVDVISDREKQLIPRQEKVEGKDDDTEESDSDSTPYWQPDYEKASIEALVESANAWMLIPTMVKDNSGAITTDYTDTPHDTVHCIVGALANRKAFKEARECAQKMLKADTTMKEHSTSYEGIFQSLYAECSEAMGDPVEANKAYKSIPAKERDEWYDDEAESLIGDLCPAGTLPERIARTQK
jgi:hypothetical protein